MTIDQFLAKFRSIVREKKLQRSSAHKGIRAFLPASKNPYYCHCPITLVAAAEGKGMFTIGSWAKAADALGLDRDSAGKIVSAADASGLTTRGLRRQLRDAFRFDRPSGKKAGSRAAPSSFINSPGTF